MGKGIVRMGVKLTKLLYPVSIPRKHTFSVEWQSAYEISFFFIFFYCLIF